MLLNGHVVCVALAFKMTAIQSKFISISQVMLCIV